MTALFLFGIEKYCEMDTLLGAYLLSEYDSVHITLSDKFDHEVPQ